MRKRQSTYSRNYIHATDPGTAAMLSVLPGIGQIYNGEKLKGILFLEVAAINLVMLGLFLMTQSIASGLEFLGTQFHFTVNKDVAQILGRTHAGSPLFFVYASLCLSFVTYAIRDAYGRAGIIRRNPIYKSQILELSEAASGSYIFHVTAILTFLLLALFCVIPKPPSAQITEIEFVYNQPQSKEPVITKTASDKPSIDSGKHEMKKKIKAHSSNQSNANTSDRKKQVAKKQTQRPAANQTSAPRVLPVRPNLNATISAPAPVLPQNIMAVPSPPRPVAPLLNNPLPNPNTPRLSRPALNNIAPPAPTRINNSASTSATPMPSPGAVDRLQASSFPQPAPVKVPSGTTTGSLPSIKPGRQALAFLPSAPRRPEIGGGSTGTGTKKPVPVPIISGGPSGARQESGKQSGPAPAAMKSRPGNSGGRMVAIAPELNPGGAGKTGAGTPGNSAANSRPNSPPSIAAAPVDFGPYMADLQRRIKQAWFPPRGQESRRVIVTFTVHRNGSMSHMRLSDGSGVAEADKAALDAVANAAPFGRLPEGSEPSVDIEFTFDYNVFSGGRGTFRRL